MDVVGEEDGSEDFVEASDIVNFVPKLTHLMLCIILCTTALLPVWISPIPSSPMSLLHSQNAMALTALSTVATVVEVQIFQS